MNCSKKPGRAAAFLVMIILVFICTACGLYENDLGVDKSQVYVAVITKSTTSEYWKTTFAGANAAGAEYNLKVTYDGPENEEDYETQNEMIRKAVSDGADAIVFSAVDYNANASAIDEAVGKGVKVVVIDSDVNSDLVSCRISTDNYKAGQMVGEAVVSGDEDTFNVGIVNFDQNSENGQQREKGFRDSVEGNGKVSIISAVHVNSTTEEAKQATIKMIEENPEINIIVTFNEWTSLGVGYAVQELGVAEKVRVVAFDSNVVSVGMLETGEVDALIVQNPYAMGYLGVEYACMLANGEKIKETDIDTTTTLITRENMYVPDNQKVLFPFEQIKN